MARGDGPHARARRAARRERRRAVRRIGAGERELSGAWARIERRLQRALASLDRSSSEDAIAERIRREVLPSARARRTIVERTVEASAELGLEAAAAVGRGAFDALGARPIDHQRALELATDHLRGARAIDGVSLSARLHASEERTVRAMAAELHETMRAGHSVEVAAQRLLEVDDAVVELPAYIRRVRDAARLGDTVRLRTVIDEHVADLDRLDDPTLRAAGREFLARARRATSEDVERQVQYWVRDRALYQQRVVARTESARVHTAAFVESTRGQPWTKGYRWELSPQHPKPDVCDLYAHQDIDGLGPGGYTLEGVPALPAHPNCLCFLTAIVDDAHFDRELARARGLPEPPEAWRSSGHETASEWLRRQPSELQATLLGPGRHRVWLERPEQVIAARGELRPLWRALGLPRPPQRVGVERVRVAGVDPFREAGARTPREPTPAPRRRRRPDAQATPQPTPARRARDRFASAIVSQRGDRIRSATRSWIASVYGDEVRSWDVAEQRRSRTLRVARIDARAFHSWTGEIVIERSVMEAARAGMTALSTRSRGELLPAEVQGFRTIIHEEMHGHSSLRRGAYRYAGKVLEEVGVELHARELVERILELPAGSLGGSYQPWVANVRAVVRDAFPEEADVDGRIRRAARRAWREPIDTHEDYVERFVEGLGPAPERRAALHGAIRSLRP